MSYYVCTYYIGKFGGKRFLTVVQAVSKLEAKKQIFERNPKKKVVFVSVEKSN